jgi:hypothetical protein
MDFINETFDDIYCYNVLHLFRENERRLFLKRCWGKSRENSLFFFTVFSEKEGSFGKGREVERNTFESKPGRPVHYFTEQDLLEHFAGLSITESGIMEDPENHGEQGPHSHVLRYVVANKSYKR